MKQALFDEQATGTVPGGGCGCSCVRLVRVPVGCRLPGPARAVSAPRCIVKHVQATRTPSGSCSMFHARLDAQLGAAPVAALGVVADGVVSAVPDPVRDGAVLTGLLGQHLLGAEALVRRHGGRVGVELVPGALPLFPLLQSA